MADADTRLPVRTTALDSTVEVANASGTTINPAKEDGNLATIAGWDNTGKAKTDLEQVAGAAVATAASGVQKVGIADSAGASITEGQKAMASSLPVVIASDQSAIPVTLSGDSVVELPQYNTAVAVAANASSTQSYTPGSTMSLDGFDGGSSGQAKWELQYGTTGSETTKVVQFTSKGDLNVRFRFPNPIPITSSMTVKLIRTNMDNQALDLYSTIEVH